jgi:glycosyltransferase involved in cell wall biosynthesis
MLRDRHIVHVIGTLQAGGVQKLVLGLAEAPPLRNCRHSAICTFGARGELASQFAAAGIKSLECSFPWPYQKPLLSYRLSELVRHALTWTFPYRLAQVLRRMKAELVHTHITSHIDSQAVGIMRQACLPWVWTVHGLYKPPPAELLRWRKAARLAATRGGRITADSTPVAEDFVQRGAGAAGQIQVVHAGADVKRFQTSLPRDPEWRARWNIPTDAVLFGSCGRLVQEKAYEIFIRAAGLFRPGAPEAHFLIAGDGGLKGLLEAEIARLGLRQCFHLVGFQGDVPQLLKQFDVFVLSSRSEGFPLALIEALASGLPCIATAVGGVPEMLGQTGGFVVPSESPESLASAMQAMLPLERRRAFHTTGPHLAQHYSYEACADQFARIYAELLDHGSHSSNGLSRRVEMQTRNQV